MTQGVNTQEAAVPEQRETQEKVSDKEFNFRRIEAAREAEKEARIRAEMQNEMLRGEIENIKNSLLPKEKDPLDEVEDYVDAPRLKAKFEKERLNLQKEAKAIAKQTFEELEKEKSNKNFLERLKSQFPDYDQVMNENTIANLEKVDPVFLETVLEIPGEYERRLKTYKKLKTLVPPVQEKISIKEKVEENAKNPYYIPPSSGTPGAVDFDVKSPAARQQAYEKLKAAQRNPIGHGMGRV